MESQTQDTQRNDKVQYYSVVLEDDFKFSEIPEHLINGLLNKKKECRSQFNENNKREFVRLCATQLFLERNEFHFRRQGEVIESALRDVLSSINVTDQHITNLKTSILDYRRNTWMRKGKSHHDEWKREKEHKRLHYKKGVEIVQKHIQKSPVVAKVKAFTLPEIRKTETELAQIRSDLKKHFISSDNDHNVSAISLLLESSYYDRVSLLRDKSGDYTYKQYVKQYPILTISQWLYYEWRMVKAYMEENYM